jgi:hypothetical protein
MNPTLFNHAAQGEPQACVIQRSADYHCQLSLRPLDALDGQTELLITSHWAGARRPDAAQVRFKATLGPEGLDNLRALLDSFVGEPITPPNGNR